MRRLFAIFAIFSFVLSTSTAIFAQSPSVIKEDMGRRAAKIPQTEADTGIQFDEAMRVQAARDYFDGALFSGENAGKTKQQIESEAFRAVSTMQNTMAFKAQSSSSWVPIAS
ncbi:MAG: hypothetical protein ABI778_11885, partial [Ignavibacteriota bacterium]